MKQQAVIIILGILLALGMILFAFNIQKFNILGFAAYGGAENQSLQENNQTITTLEEVLQAMNDSEEIITEMQENNLSATYVNDILIEARRVLEQVNYAEILRGNSSETEKQEARNMLGLAKWQDITYSDVLAYTDGIKQRRDEAFLLLDKLSVQESGLLYSPPEISEETRDIFERAKLAFSEERYADAEKLLEEYRNAVEQERAQSSTLAGIRSGAMNFFQKYWIYILIILVLALIIGCFAYKKLEKVILKNKIRKMKAEASVLDELMKKTQTERFKENKISGLVYNIRIKKYQERQQEINEELPALEERAEGRKIKNAKYWARFKD